jgi:hypothetical protein
VLAEKLVVPRLRVRKDWYKGLDDDPIDHTHPDVGFRPDAQDGSSGLLSSVTHCRIFWLVRVSHTLSPEAIGPLVCVTIPCALLL